MYNNWLTLPSMLCKILSTSKHHCFKSANLLKTDGDQIYLISVSVVCSLKHATDTKHMHWTKSILLGA